LLPSLNRYLKKFTFCYSFLCFVYSNFDASKGTKFFVTVDRNRPNVDALLRVIYEYYTDFVLKNPFYEMEQPIHCEQFDVNLEKLLK